MSTLDLPEGVRAGAPATPDVLAALERALPLPREHIALLTASDGASGWFGSAFVQLWSARELIANNVAYNVAEFAPDLVLIGSDGGGEAFAVVIATGEYVSVPFIGMESERRRPLGRGLAAFFENLRRLD